MMEKQTILGAGLVFSTLDQLLSQQQAARLLMQKKPYRKASQQTGSHQVRQLGRGMEFAESRLYSPGDDIRSMDWKVTARTGQAYTKLFEEERERPVLLWCDLRPTMFFATQGQFKSVVMSELSALLAWKSWLNGDRIGAQIVTTEHSQALRPARSKSKVLQLLQTLAHDSQQRPELNQSSAVNLADTWKRLRRVLTPGSQVVLLSDFRGLNAEAEKQLQRVARHAELTLIAISDPFEHKLPQNTQLKLTDGLRFFRLNTAKPTVQSSYQAQNETQTRYIQRLATQCHARLVSISTDDSDTVRLAKLRGDGL